MFTTIYAVFTALLVVGFFGTSPIALVAAAACAMTASYGCRLLSGSLDRLRESSRVPSQEERDRVIREDREQRYRALIGSMQSLATRALTSEMFAHDKSNIVSDIQRMNARLIARLETNPDEDYFNQACLSHASYARMVDDAIYSFREQRMALSIKVGRTLDPVPVSRFKTGTEGTNDWKDIPEIPGEAIHERKARLWYNRASRPSCQRDGTQFGNWHWQQQFAIDRAEDERTAELEAAAKVAA